MTDNKPLSKEEIYARAIVKEADKNYLPSADQIEKYIETIKNNVELFRFMRGALLAMDEYARQEAIGFIKFCVDGSYDKVAGDYDGFVSFQIPPEELYSLYLKSKENIEP